MTTSTPRLLLIWAIACVAAALAAFAALTVMIPEGEITYATALPPTTYTTPMIAVVVFWGIVRACGVPLDPMRTFVLGAVAVYTLVYVVGRVLAVTGVSPLVAWFLTLGVLMGLAWAAISAAGGQRR